MDAVESDPIRERLQTFILNNPEAEYRGDGGTRRICRPWGDPTLELRIPEDNPDPLIDALNAVYLPPRFTAVWHRDSRDLELIYTAHPVEQEVRSRSFVLRFGDREFRCEFGSASERLCTLAAAAIPVAPPTDTQHRNLASFSVSRHTTRRGGNGAPPEPTSFWIRHVEWDENAIAELARHLNFYMRHFDRESPVMLVHDEPRENSAVKPRRRYPLGDFPPIISARPLDPYLLGLWSHSLGGDPFLRFLHGYQILEYAAFYYSKESVLHTLRRILASPETPSRLDDAVRRAMDALAEDRTSEEHKLVSVFKQLVDPRAVWDEIEPNKDYFCGDVRFDGGCSIEPLLKPDWGFDDFVTAWIPKFPDSLRKLRNAFVHSRDPRLGGAILRTAANYDRMRPWLAPVSVAADQVILYRDT